MYGNNIPIQKKILPNITITTDQSALNHIKKAQVLIKLAEYDKSIQYLTIIAKEYNGSNKEVNARILGGLARNYLKIGLNEEAIRYWKQAIKLIETDPDKAKLKAVLHNNIALSFLNIGKTEQARQYLLKSLKISPVAETYQLLSKLALDTDHNFKLSKQYLNAGLKATENLPISKSKGHNNNWFINKINRAYIIEGFAYYYFKKGDYKTSIEKYNEVLLISEELKKIELKTKIFRELGYVYHSIGDVKKSNNYYIKYINLNDSLKVIKNKSLSIAMQNFILEKKAGPYKKEAQIITKKMKMLFALATIMILFVLFLVFKSYKKQRKNVKTIKSSRKENQDLKKRLDTTFNEVVNLAKKNDPSFLSKFKQVYPVLYKKLNSQTKALTDSEISLCAMIWLKFSTKEIAKFTYVQHKSVQIKKYRLRKKLSLPKGIDLYKWMDTL